MQRISIPKDKEIVKHNLVLRKYIRWQSVMNSNATFIFTSTLAYIFCFVLFVCLFFFFFFFFFLPLEFVKIFWVILTLTLEISMFLVQILFVCSYLIYAFNVFSFDSLLFFLICRDSWVSSISTTPPLSADNSDYCSGGGISGVYQSLVMTLGYFKLEQFVALK